MAIPHVQAGQPVDARPLGDALSGAQTTALFKNEDLELIRLIVPAGKRLPPHSVPGEIVLHCLEGCLELDFDGRRQTLRAGELLFLQGGVEHGVTGIENASALLTIALRG